MASIFTKIINGDIPSYKLAESEKYYAFLDINPLAKGHTLVVPKKEVDYLFDLDDDTYSGFFLFIKKIAEAIKQSTGCKRVGVMVYGLDVPHAHVHLVPLKGVGNELNFSNPKLKLTREEFEEIAQDINRRIVK
ncbi:MAG: HIT family protein [Bacteroidetes bacterium]|nr:HIT family protein [Bacteroidota bacterium]